MRDQYTPLEYLQIAVFLVGTPLAALMGAMLGLVGKWKEGRVFTAALMGLGSAAFVTVVLFLTFLVIHWQMQSSRQSILLEFFDSYFGQRIAILAAIATAVIALLAGIGLRARRNVNGRAASFSMWQLLLLQLFAFIALGCWTGMRFFALESGTALARMQRIWGQREWFVSGESQNSPSHWVRDFSMSAPDVAKENAYLREAVRTPSLKTLSLAEVSFAKELAIEELANATKLETLFLSFSGGADFDPPTLAAIGAAHSVQTLMLSSRGRLSQEIEPIAELPNLHTLLLQELTVTPNTLRVLSYSKSLRRLRLHYATNLFNSETPAWPSQLDSLSIRHAIPNSAFGLSKIGECKSLNSLAVYRQRLSQAEVEAISQCTALETLSLDDAINEPDLSLLLNLKKLRILTIFEASARRGAEFLKALEELALMPNLENLNCDHQMVVTAEEWSGAKRMPSDEMREARQIAWIEQINVKRATLGLKLLRVTYSINAGPFLIVGGSASASEGDEAAPTVGETPSMPSLPTEPK